MIVAFDLDGTLCNIEHRLHYIKDGRKDWQGFFNACVDDKPVEQIIRACQTLHAGGHTIEIWSGRRDSVREKTERWLFENEIAYSILRMRKDGDYRPDHIVKEEWLTAIPSIDRPVLVFDDRARVVEMWRANGIKCCQVEPGDF